MQTAHKIRSLMVMPNLNRSSGDYDEKVPPMAPAHGIMYVSSYLKSRGFSVDTVNLNHYPASRLREILSENTYDVILTGGLFTYMTKFEEIFSIAREMQPGIRTVLGGPVVTAHPSFAVETFDADFVVVGEGELTSAALLSALEDGHECDNIPGLGFKRDGKFIQTGRGNTVDDLDSLPLPDYEGFEFGEFLKRGRPANQDNATYLHKEFRPGYVVGGRDCPGRCTFCFHVTKGHFRIRSVDNIISEIKFLVEHYGVNDIEIVDDLFSIKKERVFDFCEKIAPLEIPWQCQMRVSGVTEELLKAMKKAGCYLISYGFESASGKVLRSMKKGITVEQIERVIEPTRRAGITLQANFIFGDPEETLETARETLDFYHRHRGVNLGFVKPYPGSELYHNLVDRGKIKDLRHFWIHSAIDIDGPVNMTRLPWPEFRLLNAWVMLERCQNEYFEIVSVRTGLDDGSMQLRLKCPWCGGVSAEVTLKRPGKVMCPLCFRRASLDPLDFEDGGRFKKILKRGVRHCVIQLGKVLLAKRSVGKICARPMNLLFSLIFPLC